MGAPNLFFDRPFLQKRSRVWVAPTEAAFLFAKLFSLGLLPPKKKADKELAQTAMATRGRNAHTVGEGLAPPALTPTATAT